MNKKIVQLGYGKMGRVVLDDLLKTAEFDELVVADAGAGFSFNIEMVRDPRVKAVVLNVDDKPALINLLRDAAVVIELLPIRYTMQVAQAAVEAGTHMVSSVFIIDWSIRDQETIRLQQKQLDDIDRLAKAKGLTVLKEFGMDPGLDVIVAAETLRNLDQVNVLYTYGAGFPEARLAKANPIGYKFTWSVIDTIYSYAIPGSIRKQGQVHEIRHDAMFEPGNYHILNLEEMGGPLECFVNGDGDSLARLFPAIAKTATSLGRFICRRPGHAAFWNIMVKCGFNSSQPVNVDGVEVIPAAFCAALLASQPQFHYGPGERDVALIRADARGIKQGRPVQAIGQLVDYRDLATGYTAMQRTVAFPISIGAQMIVNGTIAKRGIVEPSEVPFAPFLLELRKRGLDVTQKLVPWDGDADP
jgi:saccharopine dehydrogenase-like NADP-dependent oxidoreductase